VDDWDCLKNRFNYVLARVKREGYDLSVNEIEVVTPDSYEKWKKVNYKYVLRIVFLVLLEVLI